MHRPKIKIWVTLLTTITKLTYLITGENLYAVIQRKAILIASQTKSFGAICGHSTKKFFIKPVYCLFSIFKSDQLKNLPYSY